MLILFQASQDMVQTSTAGRASLFSWCTWGWTQIWRHWGQRAEMGGAGRRSCPSLRPAGIGVWAEARWARAASRRWPGWLRQSPAGTRTGSTGWPAPRSLCWRCVCARRPASPRCLRRFSSSGCWSLCRNYPAGWCWPECGERRKGVKRLNETHEWKQKREKWKKYKILEKK